MKRFLYELSESWKIAVAQMRSNITRSTLTALGVIIGIVAVTLMGTAIGGIQIGFDKSMAIFGEDILYVGQWPWKNVDDWWNYRDRKKIKTEYAEGLNRMIAMTPNSNLAIAIPTSSVYRTVKYTDSEVNNVLIRGTVSDYIITSTFDFKEGRFFNELESRGGANVCVLGYDVADPLFPSSSPIDKSVLINGQPFKVLGVISRQGSFLGLFSLDAIVVMPLPAFQKYFTAKSEAEVLLKVRDKTKLAEAKDEQGKMLPGVAPVAIQEGRFVAKVIRDEVHSAGGSHARPAFHYWDKGSLATIGRAAAVAQFGRIHISGFVAWLSWLFVHILFLIGFRNRLLVFIQWAWSYVTYERGARLITGSTELPGWTPPSLEPPEPRLEEIHSSASK